MYVVMGPRSHESEKKERGLPSSGPASAITNKNESKMKAKPSGNDHTIMKGHLQEKRKPCPGPMNLVGIKSRGLRGRNAIGADAKWGRYTAENNLKKKFELG